MIRELYWKIVPYDWRPHQIIYALKCYFFKRYTTYKPRYLNHQWHDRDVIMAHMMMEILSQFVEDECSPGCVDWYSREWPDGKIEFRGQQRFVRDVFQIIYDWWHEVYNKWYPAELERLWSRYEERGFEEVKDGIWLMTEPSNHNKAIHEQIEELENYMEDRLDDYLELILKLRRRMWT